MGKIFMSDNAITFEFPEITRELITPLHIGSAETEQPIIPVMAIWDTGANYTMIRPEIAKKLNLKPIGTGRLTSLTGAIESKKYRARIYLSPQRNIKTEVVESYPYNCDILIGMDIISAGDFAISNFNGKTTLTFRCPSVATLDFNRI